MSGQDLLVLSLLAVVALGVITWIVAWDCRARAAEAAWLRYRATWTSCACRRRRAEHCPPGCERRALLDRLAAADGHASDATDK